jgi:hypothetical protein
VAVWDVAKGKVLWKMKLEDEKDILGVESLGFSPNGKVLAVGLSRGSDVAILCDATTGRVLRRLSVKGGVKPSGMSGLAFSPDGRWLVTANKDDSIFDVWAAETGEPLRRVKWESNDEPNTVYVFDVIFSPDGKALLVNGIDGVLRVYEAATWGRRRAIACGMGEIVMCSGGRFAHTPHQKKGLVQIMSWRGEAKSGRRTEKQLDKLWEALGSKDAAKGFDAIRELLATPEQAVALLSRLPKIELTRKKLDRLVADLDDDDFDVREKATDALKQAGHLAEAALRAGLAKKPSLEVRWRLSKLLKAVDLLTPQRLRFLRAVEVLEALRTPAAQKQLERLADGAAGNELTEDAKAAFARLRQSAKR